MHTTETTFEFSEGLSTEELTLFFVCCFIHHLIILYALEMQLPKHGTHSLEELCETD